MAFNLASISKGKIIKAPRILVLGTEKVGKTTWACGTVFENGKIVKHGSNDPILLPIIKETGADGLDIAKFPAATTFPEVIEAISSLYSEEHSYRTLVLDSASSLGPILYDDVCAEFGVSTIRKVPGFRVGDAALLVRWRQILSGLDALRDDKNMSIIMTGHVKVRKHKNPEGDDYDCWDFDLDGEISDMIKRWVDLIAFCNTKVSVKKEGEDTTYSKAKRQAIDLRGGQRFMYCQKNPAYPSGGRDIFGGLPKELPLEWQAFQNAVAELMK